MPEPSPEAVPDLPVTQWDRRRLGWVALACAAASGLLAGLWQRWQGDGLAEAVFVGLSAACFGPLLVAGLWFLVVFVANAVIGVLFSAPVLIATLIGFVLHFPRRWMLALAAMNERGDMMSARVSTFLAKPILWCQKPAGPARDQR
ncbi:MAG: hypothetical protein DI616_03010 [Paracoccus denitrificans]|uniref:Uncharacterized protein n=1 Tax=Paracoccus denitrificans TaxID=266 RepID=A0A533IAE3_PARDE|nr:MAG: hypothetical protein DI616_03010 [Paracoccus denitrificans]